MTRRRATWLLHNALMTPLIPIHVVLLTIYHLGNAAEWIGLRLPAWRRYNGWPAPVTASADTHPKGGDASAAPFMGSAVRAAQTPNLSQDPPHV